jgi:D-alanyl-lipoteichoic acid acyltransferase DltB (MBOAT superfamily)
MNAALDFNVAGIEFIAGMLAAAAMFFHLPATVLRQGVWAAANFLVLWLVLPNPASWIALGIFLGSGYVVAQALRAWPSRWLLASYLTLLIAAFVVLRQYPVLDWLLPHTLHESSMRILGVTIQDGALRHVIHILGLSYMLFRQIHVLVDAAQGQIERFSLWSYVNYQVSLFTILAGPIQRFQDFDEQWRTLDPVLADPHELLSNCARLFIGVLKIALIAPLFYKGWDELAGQLAAGHFLGWKAVAYFCVVFYFYPLYLYFNFAGYCDIVIAANRFFGMKLPENFNRPWLARNVIEFWTRWHITLGTWIRDYLFMPMYKPVVERWPSRAQNWAWLFYFLAFVVAGVWHGTTLNYFCYGVWQGFGMSVTKIYETWLLKRRGRQGLREYMKSNRIRIIAILANLHFQCISMLIFSQRDVRDAWELAKTLFTAFSGHRY